MTKTQMKVGLAVLAVGLLASVTSASAGYRGHANLYAYESDSYGYNSGSEYSGHYITPYYRQSDEIRELQRFTPRPCDAKHALLPLSLARSLLINEGREFPGNSS